MPDPTVSLPEAPLANASFAPVGRLALQFGLATGLLYGAWLLGLHLTGNNAFGPKRLLLQLLVPLVVVASQWKLRREVRPAKPGFLRALGVGLLTAVVAASVAAGSLYGLSKVAGEQAMAQNRAELLEIARVERAFIEKKSGGKAAYEQHLTQLSRLSAADLAQDDFSKIIFLGLLLMLPGAVFFRE